MTEQLSLHFTLQGYRVPRAIGPEMCLPGRITSILEEALDVVGKRGAVQSGLRVRCWESGPEMLGWWRECQGELALCSQGQDVEPWGCSSRMFPSLEFPFQEPVKNLLQASSPSIHLEATSHAANSGPL